MTEALKLIRIPAWMFSSSIVTLVALICATYWLGPIKIFGYVTGFTADEHPISATFPPGAVVAFADLPVARNGYAQCPDGWSEVTETRGRFILGADPNLDYGSGNNTSYTSKGGEPTVTLSLEQIPSHTHTYQHEADEPGGCGRAKCGHHPTFPTFNTGPAGGDSKGETVPHNNMPPYIALTFCKKAPSVKEKSNAK